MIIDLAVLEVSGKNALDFLQGQLTCDVRLITEIGKFYSGALCNHQGRVIASVDIQKILSSSLDEQIYHVYLPDLLAETVLKYLERYAIFSELNLNIISSRDKKINLLDYIQKKIAVILPETSEKFTPHEFKLSSIRKLY